MLISEVVKKWSLGIDMTKFLTRLRLQRSDLFDKVFPVYWRVANISVTPLFCKVK